jgi:hypothetical protein
VLEEEEVVSEEAEEAASVEVVDVSEELTADVSVPVTPVEVRPRGEMPPNAPETNRPATNIAANPSVPLMCHACAFFLMRVMPPPLLRTARASPDRRHTNAGRRARRSGQARNSQIAADLPPRSPPARVTPGLHAHRPAGL